MNLKRWIKFLYIDPNSSEGLIIRAEMLEEEALKPKTPNPRALILYATVLRELASKGWNNSKNKQFIKENLRP